jgi:hypothetical protein
MTDCVTCGTPTDSTQTGSVGDITGSICPDCAYWADGNVVA